MEGREKERGKSDGKLPIIMCLFTVEEILWMCTRDDVGRDEKRRYKVNFQFAVMAQTRRDLNLCNRPHRTVREEVGVLAKLARLEKGVFVQRCYDSFVNHGVTQAGMRD